MNKNKNDFPDYDNLENFNSLDLESRSRINEIVLDVKKLLQLYGKMSYMYPDWFDVKHDTFNNYESKLKNLHNKETKVDLDNDLLFFDIGMYIFSHMLDPKYLEVPNFKLIGRPIYRGLWDIATVIDFADLFQQDKSLQLVEESDIQSTNQLNLMFLHVFSVFCVLSKIKSAEEFEYTFNSTYKNITGVLNTNDVPLWCLDLYTKNLPLICQLEEFLSIKNLLDKIGSDELFALLVLQFRSDHVSIQDVVNIDDEFSLVTKEFDFSKSFKTSKSNTSINNYYHNHTSPVNHRSNYQIQSNLNQRYRPYNWRNREFKN